MEPVTLDLGGNINYLQDLAVSADGSNLLDIIDQNVPGYHRVTKTDPFQDPLDDEPFCCMHRQQHILTSGGSGGGTASSAGSVTSAMCETVSLDLSPNITEDFQKMYSDWQQHLGSLQGSEDEDLVVDEVVSLSMGKNRNCKANCRNRKSSSCTTTATSLSIIPRQRNESVSSITGPCIPPDLLLDTSRHEDLECDEVEDETVLTEIAGLLDGDLTLEENVIISDDGIISLSQTTPIDEEVLDVGFETEENNIEEGENLLEDLENLDGEKNVNETKVEMIKLSENQIKEVKEIAKESLDQSKISSLTGGSFKTVAELIGNKRQSLASKKLKSKDVPKAKSVQVKDGNEMKLKAGSIVLAVVNESGSLVPLPVKNNKLGSVLKSEASLEEEIDVETVSEKPPVLEAGDVDSLLAQFEASEAVNTPSMTHTQGDKIIKDTNSNTLPLPVSSGNNSTRQNSSQSSVNCHRPSPQGSPTHQKIKAALPKEIIEKIKASTKRKSTQMLSEPLVVRKGRGIKPQQLVQHRTTTTVQQSTTGDQRVPPPVDHDYCFSPDKQKKLKCDKSQSEECLNKLPDYFTFKASKKEKSKVLNSPDDNHDDCGKKDSGVESGDVSDASVETDERRKDFKTGKTLSIKTHKDSHRKGEEDRDPKAHEDVYSKLPPYMTDIGNTKPKINDEESQEKENCHDYDEKDQQQKQEVKIKKKLNLSEYRQRLQSAQSSRCPSPTHSEMSTSDKNVNNNPLSLGELILKMKRSEDEQSKPSHKSKDSNGKFAIASASVDDVEEGELKGDSDHELPKSSPVVDTKPAKEKNQQPLPSPSLSSPTSKCSRESRKSSSQGYNSRRWSSSSRSRSRSRSQSRSPKVKRKRHSSRYRKSSWGKRRGSRKRSRSSCSSSRCYSRSRSRSRSCSRSRGGRSSSESSCSSCSNSSTSRSRSRSRSTKKRERKYSGNRERRRRSRSWSRSSSRFSRSRRSRSPSYRSRSPLRKPIRPARWENDERVKQVEERRVIYVGRISEGTTKIELRRRFQKYGSIVDISVHFREHGDNYGFVTFKNKDEAYNAVENGNEDPSYPRYDLCFGGRRAFCRVQYSDLDAQDEGAMMYGSSLGGGSRISSNSGTSDFDSLLRAAMKRKTR